jgi:tetratricopeptide (TPR) repeat protein
MGKTFTALMRYDEALSAFKEATSLEPRAAEPWAAFGALLIKLERYDEALKSLDYALANDIEPKEPDTYTLKAETLHALGRHNDADIAEAEAVQQEKITEETLADDAANERTAEESTDS